MQRTIAVVALALLTTTAGCSALAGTSRPDANVQSPNEVSQPSPETQRTVAVAASGQVQTAPNRAIVRVAVTARADSVETVRQQLAPNASQMQSALQEAGLDADQIVSAQYDISRNVEREERPNAPRFRGQHSFVVTLNDTDRAGEIVVTAIQNGATTVEEVRFTITPETRRDLRKQALAKAVENARDEATVAANGTGLSLAGVRTVQTADVSLQPIRQQEFALAAAGDGGSGGGVPTSFESGKVTVSAQVTVVYNATAA